MIPGIRHRPITGTPSSTQCKQSRSSFAKPILDLILTMVDGSDLTAAILINQLLSLGRDRFFLGEDVQFLKGPLLPINVTIVRVTPSPTDALEYVYRIKLDQNSDLSSLLKKNGQSVDTAARFVSGVPFRCLRRVTPFPTGPEIRQLIESCAVQRSAGPGKKLVWNLIDSDVVELSVVTPEIEQTPAASRASIPPVVPYTNSLMKLQCEICRIPSQPSDGFFRCKNCRLHFHVECVRSSAAYRDASFNSPRKQFMCVSCRTSAIPSDSDSGGAPPVLTPNNIDLQQEVNRRDETDFAMLAAPAAAPRVTSFKAPVVVLSPIRTSKGRDTTPGHSTAIPVNGYLTDSTIDCSISVNSGSTARESSVDSEGTRRDVVHSRRKSSKKNHLKRPHASPTPSHSSSTSAADSEQPAAKKSVKKMEFWEAKAAEENVMAQYAQPVNSDNEHWEVEKMVDYFVVNGHVFYKIKWKGWSDTYNEWQTAVELNCEVSRKQFEAEVCRPVTDFFPETHPAMVVPRKADFNATAQALARKTIIETIKASSIYQAQPVLVHWKSQQDFQVFCGMKMDEIKAIRSSLERWRETISRVEPNVDLEIDPYPTLEFRKNFQFMASNRYSAAVMETPYHFEPARGCECTDCFENRKCCPCPIYGDEMFPYMRFKSKTDEWYKRVRQRRGRPIYECNLKCACSSQCVNRVVQNGSEIKLSIFDTKGRGWGVKARQRIPKNAFIMEFVGEIITNKESEDRQAKLSKKGQDKFVTMFALDFVRDSANGCMYTLEGSNCGNVSHFANHSCDPNMVQYAVYVDNHNEYLPRLAMFAKRDILKNEELTFDYSDAGCTRSYDDITDDEEVYSVDDIEKQKTDLLRTPIKMTTSVTEMQCECGAKNCRRNIELA